MTVVVDAFPVVVIVDVAQTLVTVCSGPTTVEVSVSVTVAVLVVVTLVHTRLAAKTGSPDRVYKLKPSVPPHFCSLLPMH